MVAADWYGVFPEKVELSARVTRLAPTLDALVEPDAEFVETLAKRLPK